MWKPMHQQPVYAHCRVRNRHVADNIFRRGLCLPSGSGLTDEDRWRVVHSFRSALERCSSAAAA
jgi:dTDP-4-amino-4,6-dideoxygalactose transaminase